MPKMNGKKIPYPDAEKRMGGGGLKMVKNKQGDKVPFYAADGKGKMMGGGKVMYRGGGSLSYGKMKMGGGGVAEDIAAAGIGGAFAGAAGAAAGAKIKEGSTRGPNPSELDGREKEEQEEYLRRLKRVNKAATTGAAAGAAFGSAGAKLGATAAKRKEKKGMGGSIARGSGAARAQQFRKNG